MNWRFFTVWALAAGLSACAGTQTGQATGRDTTPQVHQKTKQPRAETAQRVRTGAERLEAYLPLLDGKRVSLVVNQTSVVPERSGARHVPLADTLLSLGIDVRSIMSPEHGYQGTAAAGKAVADSQDAATGIPIRSLYGQTHKPRPEWMKEADVVVFDLQDVGTRFYTYLSTLYYLLQSCAEEGTDLIVLDRPNPNDTIDGPMLDPTYKSFVGIVPVPLLHGCTLGELATMMAGEGWTGDAPATPRLTVITCTGWRHGQPYDLPIAPSPNLPTMQAIRLYPSLCLFEGTDISVGRGTDFPFACYGSPTMDGPFSFTPRASMHRGKTCHGIDLRHVVTPRGFSLAYLLDAARRSGGRRWITQPSFFDKLAGTDRLRQQIAQGRTEAEIRTTWQADLAAYRDLRAHYLLYDE